VTLVGKAGQRRMNAGLMRGAWALPKGSHRTPDCDRALIRLGLTLS
jgi:hypothetical protein